MDLYNGWLWLDLLVGVANWVWVTQGFLLRYLRRYGPDDAALYHELNPFYWPMATGGA